MVIKMCFDEVLVILENLNSFVKQQSWTLISSTQKVLNRDNKRFFRIRTGFPLAFLLVSTLFGPYYLSGGGQSTELSTYVVRKAKYFPLIQKLPQVGHNQN